MKDMMMNSKSEDEMESMFGVIDLIRKSDYPDIPKKLIEDILIIERNYLSEREKAFGLVKSRINEYMSNEKNE
jgi:hypothetical protein